MTFNDVIERLSKVENPYPGLRPFDTYESHLFFGRDRQIAELLGRLERNRFVAVVGMSGSGKSSLVRAGLIPALERGSLIEARARWRIVVTRPTGSPFSSIAADLGRAGLDASDLGRSSDGLIRIADRLPSDESMLLVVDQFEELFRYKEVVPDRPENRLKRGSAAAEAAEFVQLLLAARWHQPPVYIVLTMRSDYSGDCAEFRGLAETLNDCQYLVPRMTREQRKEAIEGPLDSLEIAPSLVQRVLNDAGDEPGDLPVLQHALMRTWSHWRQEGPDGKRRIELRDYEAIGGFERALNNHADELFGTPVVRANPEIPEIVFKRLTARGESSRERRLPAKLAELWSLYGAEASERKGTVTAVIDHFRQGEASFLTPRYGPLLEDTYIDIAHESLIFKWNRLRDQWIPEERESAKAFLNLLERARNWKEREGEKLTGLDLKDAEVWDRQRNKAPAWSVQYADINALNLVAEFIQASQSEERTRATREKQNLWNERPRLEEALEASRTEHGEEHPETLAAMANLARLLKEQGDLAEARKLEEQVLNVNQRLLGDEPNTLESMINLAQTRYKQGDVAKAGELLDQALQVRAFKPPL